MPQTQLFANSRLHERRPLAMRVAWRGAAQVALPSFVREFSEPGPSSPTNRASLCAARTLNTAGPSRVTLSLPLGHLRTADGATTGGEGAWHPCQNDPFYKYYKGMSSFPSDNYKRISSFPSDITRECRLISFLLQATATATETPRPGSDPRRRRCDTNQRNVFF